MIKNSINKLWLDESGDSGFRFERGSSKYFVVVFVYLEGDNIDEETAKIEKQINRLKEKFSLTADYEFKFSRCKNKLKQEFLEESLKFPIKYKVIVVNKKNWDRQF